MRPTHLRDREDVNGAWDAPYQTETSENDNNYALVAMKQYLGVLVFNV